MGTDRSSVTALYLGPDYTADYLGAPPPTYAMPTGAGSDRARQKTVEIFKRNRYDVATENVDVRRRAGLRVS